MDLCCIQCAVAEIVDNQRSMRLNSQGSYANFTAQGQIKLLQSFVSSTSVSRKLFSQEKQQNKSRFSKWPTSPNADYGNYDKKKKGIRGRYYKVKERGPYARMGQQNVGLLQGRPLFVSRFQPTFNVGFF